MKRLALLSNQHDQLSALNITWVDDENPLYPAGFRQLPDPPLGVFMRGCCRHHYRVPLPSLVRDGHHYWPRLVWHH